MRARELTVIGCKVEIDGYSKWPAWFVGHISNGSEPTPLVGWKAAEPRGQDLGWLSEEVTRAHPHLVKAGLRYGWWLEKDERVTVLAGRLTQGEVCELCHDFASFAVPNCVNGTKFVCFSCRQGWIPPHLR